MTFVCFARAFCNYYLLLSIILLLLVIPWALESWAKYDIRVFDRDNHINDFANTEHGLCVMNHRGDLDWMIGWCIIDRFRMLGVSDWEKIGINWNIMCLMKVGHYLETASIYYTVPRGFESCVIISSWIIYVLCCMYCLQ